MFGWLTRNTFTASEAMRIKARRVRNSDYTPIGRLLTIVLEASRDVTPPHERITARVGLTLEWLNAKNGPLLACGGVGGHIDYQDLLFPQGLKPLPLMPDPSHVKLRITDPDAPLIPQPLEERASGRIIHGKWGEFLVFSPIADLLILPFSCSAMMRFEGSTNPGDGTRPTLLWQPETNQGFVVGGLFAVGLARAA